MKILLLIDSLTSGGMERRMIELIKGLREYVDVQLQLIVFSDRIHYEEVYELGLPITILKRVPKKSPVIFYKLFKLCRSWQPDLIHSWGTMSAMIAIPSSKLLKIKLINGNIVDAPKGLRFFDSQLFRAKITYPFSKVIVSNSKAGLHAYKVPKSKGVCIYNGFDMNRISNLSDKGQIRKKFNVSTKHVIGMVGGFYDRKDFETFVLAAILMVKHREDVTFIAVGDGPNRGKCEAMIPSEYQGRILFTGLQRDVESIINIFNIGVLSTNTKVHGEGISNAILEYMILEKPVVATSGGGTNEIVHNLKTGILIPADSPEVMSTKLSYLIDNPEIAEEMGIAGKKRVEKLFGLKKMAKTYYDLYKDSLRSKLNF